MAERWTETDIDFVFSVPSIARERGAEALFAMAKECNFETVRGRHRVAAITLTEPEAAGFFLLNKHEAQMKVSAVQSPNTLWALLLISVALQEGDIALILDLGGGTLVLSTCFLSFFLAYRLANLFIVMTGLVHDGLVGAPQLETGDRLCGMRFEQGLPSGRY
jgi:hypothetical protein